MTRREKAFCICDNKDADQLRGNREADQRLCFRYTDSVVVQSLFFLNPKFQGSSHLLWLYSPVCVEAARKPRIPGFFTTRLILRLDPVENSCIHCDQRETKARLIEVVLTCTNEMCFEQN